MCNDVCNVTTTDPTSLVHFNGFSHLQTGIITHTAHVFTLQTSPTPTCQYQTSFLHSAPLEPIRHHVSIPRVLHCAPDRHRGVQGEGRMDHRRGHENLCHRTKRCQAGHPRRGMWTMCSSSALSLKHHPLTRSFSVRHFWILPSNFARSRYPRSWRQGASLPSLHARFLRWRTSGHQLGMTIVSLKSECNADSYRVE